MGDELLVRREAWAIVVLIIIIDYRVFTGS